MKSKITNSNIHLALLPVFYILHAVNEFTGLISFRSALAYVSYYLLLALLTYLAGRWLLKSGTRAGLWTFLLLLPFFFFGPFHDFLKDSGLPPLLSSYKVLLALLLVYAISITVLLKRKQKEPVRTKTFLNITLGVLVLIEIFILGFNELSGKNDSLRLAAPFSLKSESLSASRDSMPDIFFIVFDEFASTRALEKYLGYDNSALDSMLAKNGFYLVPNSKSNYNITHLSLASTLNMDYLAPDLEGTVHTAEMLLRGCKEVNLSGLPALLERSGYDIRNHGLFNLPGHPAKTRQFFSRYPDKPLYLNTLYGRMRKDLYWNIEIRLNPDIEKENIRKDVARNRQNFDATIRELENPAPGPRFVYAHFMMPHMPYYFDKNGQPLANPLYVPDRKQFDSLYLGQLAYTNTWIARIVEASRNRHGRPLVMVIEGDHGYRDKANSNHQGKTIHEPP